ncbi:MAG TPA: hypothetical protein PLU50_01480 [Pseudobdellovibrionaceae bacterium]|nr:hypothetical protein [Pseudobdellovibrionaceae bacterium]
MNSFKNSLLESVLLLAVLVSLSLSCAPNEAIALTQTQLHSCLKSDLEIVSAGDCSKTNQTVAYLLSGLPKTLACFREAGKSAECKSLIENGESASHLFEQIASARSCQELSQNIDPYYAQFGADPALRNFCAEKDVLLSGHFISQVKEFMFHLGYQRVSNELSQKHPYILRSAFNLMVNFKQIGPQNAAAAFASTMVSQDGRPIENFGANDLNISLQKIIQNEQIARTQNVYDLLKKEIQHQL